MGYGKSLKALNIDERTRKWEIRQKKRNRHWPSSDRVPGTDSSVKQISVVALNPKTTISATTEKTNFTNSNSVKQMRCCTEPKDNHFCNNRNSNFKNINYSSVKFANNYISYSPIVWRLEIESHTHTKTEMCTLVHVRFEPWWP